MPRIGGTVSFTDVVPDDRKVLTTAPLTGGGDLSADRTLGVSVGTAAGTVAAGNDPRLNDARAWVLHSGTPNTVGQVPTWNGTTYTPQTGGAGGGGLDAEAVRDTVAAFLVPGFNISVTHDDPGNTLTISAAGGSGGTTSDATTTAKGILQLAGDLAGTAAAPTVPGKQSTSAKSTAATPVANGYIGADAAGLVPAALLPAASTTASGILQLAGDLGGSASAPVITRRGPLGGHNQIAYAATITPNCAAGNSFYVSATGNVAIANPSGAPADGQKLLLEVYASGAARTVTFSGPTVMTALGNTITIGTGKVGLVGLYYSSRATRWIVTALNAEA